MAEYTQKSLDQALEELDVAISDLEEIKPLLNEYYREYEREEEEPGGDVPF